jgi:DNA polymerase-1
MEQLHVIRTLEQLDALHTYLLDKEYVAFDTETTGLEHDSQIIGFSVSADEASGYYVVLAEWDKVSNTLLPVISTADAKNIITLLLSKNLIMHNAIFDCAVVKTTFDVDLMPHVHTDTLILAQLLDENRSNGLKDLAVSIYGQESTKEQKEMHESVQANGGSLTKKNYELYKADSTLIAKYGAKDTILTFRLFFTLVEQLYAQNLQDFFYLKESMPLLRSGTYSLSTVGLKIDTDRLASVQKQLEADILDAKSYVLSNIHTLVREKYPGTNIKNTFNLGSTKQLAWLVFHELGEPFHTLTENGKELCKAFGMSLPYNHAAKADFMEQCRLRKGATIQLPSGKTLTVSDSWNYLSADKATLERFATKYKWVQRYLEYTKNKKLLTTYAVGIRERIRYGIIRPSFLQHGTTSGRYASRNPNFQNLPREDKRIKSCIVARPGKVFIGADYAQLEPRVFASFSNDRRLQDCFSNNEDFYSVIGKEVFNKPDSSVFKDDPQSFAKLYPDLRQIAKVISLAATYGTTAAKLATMLKRPIDECQTIIDKYFDKFPSVLLFMLTCHTDAKTRGEVKSLFGRPRRIPEAMEIEKYYRGKEHHELPYIERKWLNLAVNHVVQSTAASIVNRTVIAFSDAIRAYGLEGVNIVLQVHDELVAECPENMASTVKNILQECMEKTIKLPGVKLQAEPKIAKNLADLK